MTNPFSWGAKKVSAMVLGNKNPADIQQFMVKV